MIADTKLPPKLVQTLPEVSQPMETPLNSHTIAIQTAHTPSAPSPTPFK